MAYWQKVPDMTKLPENTVCIGKDVDGHEVYVARAFVEKELVPGKLIPKKNACFMSYLGREVKVTDYEVLIATTGHAAGSVTWVPVSNGKVPKRAIEAGHNGEGIKFYVGRKLHNGNMVCGKIHKKYGVLYFPLDGYELSSKTYEALAAV